MELLQPTKNHRVTQHFGERKEVYGGIGHTGVDLGPFVPGKEGDSILAPDRGLVIRNTYDVDGYGNYIDLRLLNWINPNTDIVARFGHLLKSLVKTGDTVNMGDEIGLMDSTGWSSGDHLHFEIRINGKPVDPEPYLTLTYNEFMNQLQQLRKDHEDAFAATGKQFGEVNERLTTVDGRLNNQSTRINEAVNEAKDGNKILRVRVEKTIGKELEKLSSDEREKAVGSDQQPAN